MPDQPMPMGINTYSLRALRWDEAECVSHPVEHVEDRRRECRFPHLLVA